MLDAFSNEGGSVGFLTHPIFITTYADTLAITRAVREYKNRGQASEENGYRRNQDNGIGFLKFNLDTKKEKEDFSLLLYLR
jgi:hypothetical protein